MTTTCFTLYINKAREEEESKARAHHSKDNGTEFLLLSHSLHSTHPHNQTVSP